MEILSRGDYAPAEIFHTFLSPHLPSRTAIGPKLWGFRNAGGSWPWVTTLLYP